MTLYQETRALTILHPQKILIVRTDRIGDVVLTLPVIAILKSAFPGSSISFLLRSYTRELAEGQEGLDEILLYDENQVRKPFFRMLAELRKKQFDAVVITYPTARLALLMFLARIPIRVGTGYRWYSLLVNRRIYEHRKTAEKHESEYNFALLRGLGVEHEKAAMPRLAVSDEAGKEAGQVLDGLHLSGKPLIILHPGSGGSARDWKPERFGELAAKLAGTGHDVLITGGPGENRLVDIVRRVSGGKAKGLPSTLGLKTLAAVLERADVFVANSTGPLHIAAATGVPVVAFYPPIAQCSSRRWGPLSEKKVIFEPSASDCPVCRGGECRGNDCMDLITVESVLEAVEKLLAQSRRKERVFAKV